MKMYLPPILQVIALLAVVTPSSASCPYLMARNVTDASAEGLDNPHEKTATTEDKPCDDSPKQNLRHLKKKKSGNPNTDPGGDFPLTFPTRSINGIETSEAGSMQIRIAKPDFGDKDGSMRQGPNPRKISNSCAVDASGLRDVISLTDMTWQWGQFVDHDIVLTEAPHEPEHQESASISCPPDDMLGPELSFTRSEYVMDKNNVRQQVNRITAAIDGSAVYGSDDMRAEALREMSGGRLKVSGPEEHPLLPENDSGLPNAGDDPSFFLAGDVRANEQLGLISMHTLFVREHNRLAEKISDVYRDVDDEKIYQLARKIVGAEIQIITYKEFLPTLLGDMAPELSGYDDSVDTSIANEFATAAYRFGHSMLSTNLNLGHEGKKGEIPLKDAFFRPDIIRHSPELVDQLLAGLISSGAQPVDAVMIDDVRNFLFGNVGGGLDLASLNIQRGRDHGIPGYNAMRKAYKLDEVKEFLDTGKKGKRGITKNRKVAAALEAVYGTVDEVDAWIGGLCEDTMYGVVGELIATALNEQFTRIMKGDPFFYLNDNDLKKERIGDTIIDLENISLAQVIAANTGLKPSGNVFKMGG